jgi:hypothetical protein
VSSDGTSTPDGPGADPGGADAEQFAAALDDPAAGCGEDSVEGDPDLTREVALARRLAAFGSALDPEPQARERARRRLLAALDREAGGDAPSDGPSRAS